MYIINIIKMSLCLQRFIVGDKSYFSQEGGVVSSCPPRDFRLCYWVTREELLGTAIRVPQHSCVWSTDLDLINNFERGR